jgi:uncharacterized Rossmann fold enzyme
MFNTLKYARMLEDVGFSRDQAETSIKILAETMEDKLASKQDLKDLEVKLTNSIAQLDLKVQNSLAQSESTLTIRMGTMLAASIAIITALQVYVFKLLALHS